MSQTITTPSSVPSTMLDRGAEDIERPVFDAPALGPEQLQLGVNLTPFLDDAYLDRLGADCKRHIEIDDASRAEWLDISKRALDLAMQVAKEKSYPHQRASNVVYPMIATAAIQFAQRAYAALVPGGRVVNCAVIGDDSGVFEVPSGPDGQPMVAPPQAGSAPQAPQPRVVVEPGAKASRAERVSRHMSWQCLHAMPEWEPGIDQLVHYLPIAGCAFRRVTYDSAERRPTTDLIFGDKFIINNKAKSISKAARYTVQTEYYPYEIKEEVIKGNWRDLDLGAMGPGVDHDENDDQAERVFYEHYCRLDLDGSGYEKPFIVTLHEDGKVVRVERNWDRPKEDGTVAAINEYVKYTFIPNPRGGFYDVGFGWLLANLNESVNSTLNQLFDAGHWQNAPTGFVGRGIRLGRAGDISLEPNKFKMVDASGEEIARNIWVYQHPGPSQVMFALLGLLLDAGKDISSVQDAMAGKMEQNVAPTTIMALVEQGMKTFVSIYKRSHRSLKEEFEMIYRINGQTLPAHMYAYGDVLDDPQAIAQNDYSARDQDVRPVTDPEMVSDQANQAKAGFLMRLASQGLVNPKKATKRALEAFNIADTEELMPQPAPPDPMAEMAGQRMQVEIDKVRADIENNRIELRMKADKQLEEIKELRAKVEKDRASAMKDIAQAEAEEAGVDLGYYQAVLDTLDAATNALTGNVPERDDQPSV